MRNRWQLIIQAGLLSFASAAYAQSTTTTQSAAAVGQKMTLTGCVERADQLSGATAAQSTDPDSQTFVLMRAGKGVTGPARAGVVGTTGSTASPAQGTTYRLDGSTATINPHVGHQVEITGTMLRRRRQRRRIRRHSRRYRG